MKHVGGSSNDKVGMDDGLVRFFVCFCGVYQESKAGGTGREEAWRGTCRRSTIRTAVATGGEVRGSAEGASEPERGHRGSNRVEKCARDALHAFKDTSPRHVRQSYSETRTNTDALAMAELPGPFARPNAR